MNRLFNIFILRHNTRFLGKKSQIEYFVYQIKINGATSVREITKLLYIFKSLPCRSRLNVCREKDRIGLLG